MGDRKQLKIREKRRHGICFPMIITIMIAGVLFIESLLCSRHCAWLDFPWFMTFSYCEVAEVL